VWLRIASGPDAGRSVEVTHELTLGREQGVDLVVRDERASRRHAVVAPADGGLALRDLGSANGTFLHGEPVQEVTLRPGDVFSIGEVEFEVRADEPAAPAPTYSMVGRLIEQRTRGSRRVTWAALGVATVAVGLVLVLVLTGGSGDDRVPQVVRALAPSTVLVEVSRAGARSATASGWVFDASAGHAVTNAHVVNEGDGFAIHGAGRRRPARVVAAAPCEDLAVLSTQDEAGLQNAPLGGGVEQGETVVALGYPADAGAGTTLAATRGVVSAVRTSFREPASDVPAYPEVIQTDTALNPGNSGGPLADLDGRMVAVNAAARTSSSGGRPLQNQNFAIPIARARAVVEELARGRSRGWLGVTFGYPSVDQLAEEELPPGLFITGVVAGTPAAEAGLGANELLIGINGRAIEGTLQSWCDAAGDLRTGEPATLTIQAPDGKRREVRVRMA
jgi:S1-C subfamily serine protease